MISFSKQLLDSSRRLLCCASMAVVSIAVCGCQRSVYPPGMIPPGGPAPNIANYQPAPNGGFPVGPSSVYAGGQAAPQLVELQRRAQELDTNNRQLTAQVAQIQQQSTAYRERADLLSRQLEDANRQNAQLLASAQQYANQARTLQASMESRGGARLTANSSLQPNTGMTSSSGAPSSPFGPQTSGMIPQGGFSSPAGIAAPFGNSSTSGFPTNAMPPSSSINPSAAPGGFLSSPLGGATNGMVPIGGALPSTSGSLASAAMQVIPGGLQIPGAQIIQDKNAIRVRLASDQLFAPGSAQLNPIANSALDSFTQIVSRQFPRQRIGVEVHSDSASPATSLMNEAGQLMGGQGKAIIDSLTQRGLPFQQLTLTAVGAAQPIADNQSPAGRAQNRRIELVIYQN